MIEFIIGFICGIVFLLIFITVAAKPLMRFFLRRKMSNVLGSVTSNLQNITPKEEIQDEFNQEEKQSS